MRVRNLIALFVLGTLIIGCRRESTNEPAENLRFKVTSDSSKVSFTHTDCEDAYEFTCIRLRPAITNDQATIESTLVELRKWLAKRNRGMTDWYVIKTVDNPPGILGIAVETFQLSKD